MIIIKMMPYSEKEFPKVNYDPKYNQKRGYDKVHLIHINDEVYVAHDHILNKCHYFKTLLAGEFNDKEIRLEVDDSFNFTVILDILYTDNSLQWFSCCSCIEYIQMIIMLEFLQYDNIASMLPQISHNVGMNDPADDVKNIAESDISVVNKTRLLTNYMERAYYMEKANFMDENTVKNNVGLEFRLLIYNQGERPVHKREMTKYGPPLTYVSFNPKKDTDIKIEVDNIVNFLEQYNIKINSYSFHCIKESVQDKWFSSRNFHIKLHIDDKLIYDNVIGEWDFIDIRKPIIDYAINRLLIIFA